MEMCMKKFVSIITAFAASAAMLLPMSAGADTEKYIPLYYFKAKESENVTIISDDTVQISPDDLAEGDVRLNVGVYIEDETQKIYSASAKWRCDSEYITLENLCDPTVSTGASKTYNTSEGVTFTTDLTPFCYMEVSDDGTASIPVTPDIAELPEINSMYFSCISLNANVFSVLGAATDEYPFTSFDAVIDSNTPEGIYEIIFATEDNTDGDSSVFSHGAIALSKTSFYSFRPQTKSLTIIVGDFMLGDVNEDKVIDAVDASLVLAAYAKNAVSGEYGLTEFQELAANVNEDTSIDAVDASLILSYYAYSAVGGKLGFPDYLADRN